MSDDTQQPIVVKRIKKGGGGAHGGAWKIAYADFVTAMMAFFLLMWLLGSTAQGDLEGIADHFKNPLKLSLHGGSGSGDSSSIIQGGGEDLTRSLGQVKRGDVVQTRTINLDAAAARELTPPDELDLRGEMEERERLLDLKTKIEVLIEANPNLRQLRDQLLIDITTEGLRIQIVDEQNRPMFDLASDRLRSYARELLREIGRVLNQVPNRISLSGHTDSLPYSGGERGFSNWELSANRANSSRRELVVGGLESGKVIRVVGLGDTVHLDQENPNNAINRRISIIVLNKRTEMAIREASAFAPVVELENPDALTPEDLIPQEGSSSASPPAPGGGGNQPAVPGAIPLPPLSASSPSVTSAPDSGENDPAATEQAAPAPAPRVRRLRAELAEPELSEAEVIEPVAEQDEVFIPRFRRERMEQQR